MNKDDDEISEVDPEQPNQANPDSVGQPVKYINKRYMENRMRNENK